MHGNWFTECPGLAASFSLFPVSSFSATPLGVIAQVHQDSTCACKTECGQEWSLVCCKYGRSIPFSLLVFGLVPSPAFFSTLLYVMLDQKDQHPIMNQRDQQQITSQKDQEQMTRWIGSTYHVSCSISTCGTCR